MTGVDSRPATARSVRRPLLSAVVASLLALALAAGPAGAATILHDHYSDDYAFSHDECGFTVDVAGHDEGVAHLRVGKGDLATAFFLHDNYAFLETWTRPDTGAWIAIGGNGLFNETKAVPVPGAAPFTFAFTSINAGQPFTVWDSGGNVVVRDRGVIQQVIQFNTNGDDVPGGEFIADVSFKVGGPHPGLDLDVCSLLD